MTSSDLMPGSVLIVDDDAKFRGLARRILTASGLTVVGEAESVQAAIVAADALRPDAVLLDVMLPDGDGVALAAELAALPWSPRVVLTSSYADAASEDEIDRSGAVAFFPKQELPTVPLERLLSAA
jgi:two-component system nitrate/nitrite response regulator NarL